MMLKPEEFEKYYNILKHIADIRLLLSRLYVFGHSIEPFDFISISNILKKTHIETNINYLKYQSEPLISWYSFLFFLNSKNIGIGRNIITIVSEFNRLPVNINIMQGEKIKSTVDWILSIYQNNFTYTVVESSNNILTVDILNRNSSLNHFAIQSIGNVNIHINEHLSPIWNFNESIGITIEYPELQHYYEVIGLSITEAKAIVSKNYYILKRI